MEAIFSSCKSLLASLFARGWERYGDAKLAPGAAAGLKAVSKGFSASGIGAHEEK
jgi:hypothetical protein